MAKISIDLNSGTILKESAVIGIDLGTTNSLIATINSKTQKPYCVSKDGNSIVPSTIYFDEQNILNIAYAMEEKINFKNKITDWWIK